MLLVGVRVGFSFQTQGVVRSCPILLSRMSYLCGTLHARALALKEEEEQLRDKKYSWRRFAS